METYSAMSSSTLHNLSGRFFENKIPVCVLSRHKRRRMHRRKRRGLEIEDSKEGSNSEESINRPINDVDPIMLEPLGPHVFVFTAPVVAKDTAGASVGSGSCIAFNVESLVDYCVATGNFTDPITRLPFSDTDLKNIDAQAVRCGYTDKQSLYEAKRRQLHRVVTPAANSGTGTLDTASTTGDSNVLVSYEDERFQRDALLGLERLAGDTAAEMLTIAEKVHSDAMTLRRTFSTTNLTSDGCRNGEGDDQNDFDDENGDDEEGSLGGGVSYGCYSDAEEGDEEEEGHSVWGHLQERLEGLVDNAQEKLLINAFPAYSDFYEQLHAADRSTALMCAAHIEAYLHGPPNKPHAAQLDSATAGAVLHAAVGFVKGCHRSCENAWKAKGRQKRKQERQRHVQQASPDSGAGVDAPGRGDDADADGGRRKRKKTRRNSRSAVSGTETDSDACEHSDNGGIGGGDKRKRRRRREAT